MGKSPQPRRTLKSTQHKIFVAISLLCTTDVGSRTLL